MNKKLRKRKIKSLHKVAAVQFALAPLGLGTATLAMLQTVGIATFALVFVYAAYLVVEKTGSRIPDKDLLKEELEIIAEQWKKTGNPKPEGGWTPGPKDYEMAKDAIKLYLGANAANRVIEYLFGPEDEEVELKKVEEDAETMGYSEDLEEWADNVKDLKRGMEEYYQEYEMQGIENVRVPREEDLPGEFILIPLYNYDSKIKKYAAWSFKLSAQGKVRWDETMLPRNMRERIYGNKSTAPGKEFNFGDWFRGKMFNKSVAKKVCHKIAKELQLRMYDTTGIRREDTLEYIAYDIKLDDITLKVPKMPGMFSRELYNKELTSSIELEFLGIIKKKSDLCSVTRSPKKRNIVFIYESNLPIGRLEASKIAIRIKSRGRLKFYTTNLPQLVERDGSESGTMFNDYVPYSVEAEDAFYGTDAENKDLESIINKILFIPVKGEIRVEGQEC